MDITEGLAILLKHILGDENLQFEGPYTHTWAPPVPDDVGVWPEEGPAYTVEVD